MDRRHLLAGMAGLSFASAGYAQTPQPQSLGPSGQAPGAGMASGAQALGQAEQQWQFAKFEADEQKGLAEVLRSMLEPAGTASPQGAAGAPPQPDQKHAAMIQKLQQAKAGDAFDKDYVKGQLDGHRELLQIQESFVQARPQSREAMNVAKLAAGRIREHIEMLEDLQG